MLEGSYSAPLSTTSSGNAGTLDPEAPNDTRLQMRGTLLPQLVVSDLDAEQSVLPWADAPYRATWQDVDAVFGTTPHRQALIALALSRIRTLEDLSVPIYSIWINGSFVTGEERPNDLDALILIDGDRLPELRTLAGLTPPEALIRIQTLPRYERGGTALDHQTEFQYMVYYPPNSGWAAITQSDLAYWFTVWSRLEIDRQDRSKRGKMVEDGKGFVEVRW